MANTIGWNFEKTSNGKLGNKKQESELLRVKPDCNLTIRLIGQPAKVVKIFIDRKQCIYIDDENIGERLQQKYPDKTSNISMRFVCWCIDRSDNSLKILDMPFSVAKQLGNREALVGKIISGKINGCDWKIKTNGRQGKEVRYDAFYIDETPLTTEEIEMVEKRKNDSTKQFDLTKIFKACSFEEAEKRLFDEQ